MQDEKHGRRVPPVAQKFAGQPGTGLLFFSFAGRHHTPVCDTSYLWRVRSYELLSEKVIKMQLAMSMDGTETWVLQILAAGCAGNL
jgi:hypothetical protein